MKQEVQQQKVAPSQKGSVSRFVHTLYKERANRIVIGFTGRTGSGCTTATELLTAEVCAVSMSAEQQPSNVLERKDRIIARFAAENWKPFIRLSVTSLIGSFLLEEDGATFIEFLNRQSLIGSGAAQLSQTSAQQIASEIDAIRKTSTTVVMNAKNLGGNQLGSGVQNFEFVVILLPEFLRKLKLNLGSAYVSFFQVLGDNCRRYGKAYPGTEDEVNVFSIARRIKFSLEIIEAEQQRIGKPCYLAIDAIRNPYEADWLKQHVSSFYLVAINTSDHDRLARLQFDEHNQKQISEFDAKEYPSESEKPPTGFAKIISQNIQTCLEKVDIHLHNPGYPIKNENKNFLTLAHLLTRYVCLMQHPGLVTPTREERSMQTAYTAKINSGCLSRQVGATVTDSDGAVMSVGWNDVPKGQVPCLLRDRADLFAKRDQSAFSNYEKNDEKFSSHVRKRYMFANKNALVGRSTQFCFREAYNSLKNEKNQVHTRSLHAEENAFLQLTKFGIRIPEGSVLYTTASPCELCAKKAYQLGIKSIFYIDPYPGISTSHIFGSGTNAPEMNLFTGAIGSAYHLLYEPLMPLKDELNYITSESDPNPQTVDLPLSG
jgi:deoxycytidylate deaminase